MKTSFFIYQNPFAQRIEKLGFGFALLAIVLLPMSTSPVAICILLSALCSVLVGSFSARFAVMWRDPIALCCLALVLLFAIGCLYTSANGLDALVMLKKYSKFYLALALWPFFYNSARRQLAINLLLASIMVLMGLMYGKALGVISLGSQFADASVFKDHIQTSFLLNIALIILFNKVCDKNQAYRWWYLFALALCLYAIVGLSQGRTGYVLLLALMLWMAAKQFAWRGLLVGLMLSITLFGSLWLLSPRFVQRVDVVTQALLQPNQDKPLDASPVLRVQFYLQSLHLFAKHPWLGGGTGSFAVQYKQQRSTNPHNEYLNIATQLGVVGLLCLLAVFLLPWQAGHRLNRDDQFILKSVIVVMLVGNCFNSWLMDTTQGHFYALLLAVMFGPSLFKPLADSRLRSSAQLLDTLDQR